MNVISACHSWKQKSTQLRQCWCKECTLIKLIGLLLTTMATRNGIHSRLVWAEKGTFGASTLSRKMCHRKQNYWTKIADLGIIFLWRRYLIHSYQLLHPHYGKYAVPFYWATLYKGTPRIHWLLYCLGDFRKIGNLAEKKENEVKQGRRLRGMSAECRVFVCPLLIFDITMFGDGTTRFELSYIRLTCV